MIRARVCALSLILAAVPTALAQPGILEGPFEYGGHTYYLLESSTWTEAEAAAVALGGHLATINDADENQWVWSEIATFGGQERWSWIGFTDADEEGTWEWVSGQEVEFVNWSFGEPNDDDFEDYGHMWQGGQWNDIDDEGDEGTYSLYGIVEVEPSCYPDLTGDGALDLFDFLAFVNLFNAADPAADCDDDGTYTLFDFLCFTNAFNAGC